MNKRNIIISIIVTSLIIIAVSGITYAYIYLNGYDDITTISKDFTTGNVVVDFNTENAIDNTNMILTKPADVLNEAELLEFNIGHGLESTKSFATFIYLSDIVISDNLKDEDFKWSLSIKDSSTIYSGNFSTIDTSTEILLNAAALVIDVGVNHNFEFRIWLEETAENQNHLQNGSFSGKIRIEAMR